MNRELTTFKIVITMFLIAIAFSILFVVQASAQPFFSTKTDFTTGTNPGSSAVADFNCDGKQDIALTNTMSNSVSVFLNTTTTGASTPTFSAKTDFTTGTNPRTVAVADLNGDGKPDMAVTNFSSNTVSVFFNTTTTGTATPTFSAKTDFTSGTNPFGVCIPDINRDGKKDLVVANRGSNTVSVFLNTTAIGAVTPSFSAKSDFATANGPGFIATGDINRDGKSDIVTPNNSANSISVLLNTTTAGAVTPTFSAKTDFATGTGPVAALIGDINMDGKADVIVSNGGTSTMSVLLNTTASGASSATFSAKTDFTTGNLPSGGAIGDFNNDGKTDVTFGVLGTNSAVVFLNTTTPGAATPTFNTRADFSSGASTNFTSISDFNGDGKQDLAATNGSATTVSVFLNITEIGAGSLTFNSPDEIPAGSNPYMACIADFNLDGKPDLATGSFAPAVSVMISATPIGGSFVNFFDPVNFTSTTSVNGIASGDFNLDGKPDLVYAMVSSSTVSVRLNTTTPGSTTPTFSAVTNLSALTNGYGVNVKDINGDGKPDIICASTTVSTVSVFLNTTTPGASTPTFSARTDFSGPGSTNDLCSADFNVDGKPDFATCSSLVDFMSVYLNTTTPGASTPTFGTRGDFTTAGAPNAISCGDLNGDGKQDIITANNAFNISVFFNTTTAGASTPTFSAKTDFPVNQFARGICLCDMNADGKLDVIVTSLGSASFAIYLNNTAAGASTPTFASRMDIPIDWTSRSPSTGDFNLDGKQDLAIANFNSSGSVFVYLNTSFMPLPVELSSFTSVVKGNDVTLNWSTTKEENNSGFEIERKSSNENNWRRIGFVQGQGTTNNAQAYFFSDRNLTTGRYNYRLKQIDYNGNFEYHELTSEVIIGVPSKFSLAQNYPNPFNPSTIINYQLAINSFVSLNVYDVSGREVASLVNEVKEAGYYSVQFDAKNISSGTYFYKLTSDKFSDVKKMIVIK